MAIFNKAKGLTGLNPLAYMGVEGSEAGNTVVPLVAYSVDPNNNDWQNFNIGTIWMNTSNQKVWFLVSLAGNRATWVEFTSGVGSVVQLTASDATIAIPIAGNITFPDATIGVNVDSNLQSTAVAGSFTINLKPTINLPLTNSAGTQGVIYLAGTRFINNYLNNTAVGLNAGNLTALLTGSNNCFYGDAVAANYTGAESNNIIIGAGISGVTGESNVIRIGTGATHTYISNTYSDFGTGNTFVGSASGNITLTIGSAIQNTSLGANSLSVLTTGANNTALGYDSLQNLTTGGANTCVGLTSGQDLTTGNNNTFVGYEAGTALLTGSNNIGIGQSSAGALVAAESNNIMINHPGVVGDNNILRIGNTTTPLAKSFIGGIRGITTDAADAVAVLISSTGQLGTVSSSARYKDNIEDMGNKSEVLYKLRPVTFDYKAQNSRYESVGLIAEEVHEVAPRFVVYDEDGRPETIKYQDLVPMLLNEVIKLNKRIEQLEKK